MEKNDDLRLVFCTCPSEKVAESIAETLVETGLAACVNIIPGVRSVYRWQNKTEIDKECQLIIKTSLDCMNALQLAVKKQHPYELPELIGVTVSDGSADYLDWIRNNTQ